MNNRRAQIRKTNSHVNHQLSTQDWRQAEKTNWLSHLIKNSNYSKAHSTNYYKRQGEKLLIGKFDKQPITYIKLIAKNRGELPNDHPLKKTSKSWLFVDEVALE